MNTHLPMVWLHLSTRRVVGSCPSGDDMYYGCDFGSNHRKYKVLSMTLSFHSLSLLDDNVYVKWRISMQVGYGHGPIDKQPDSAHAGTSQRGDPPFGKEDCLNDR